MRATKVIACVGTAQPPAGPRFPPHLSLEPFQHCSPLGLQGREREELAHSLIEFNCRKGEGQVEGRAEQHRQM